MNKTTSEATMADRATVTFHTSPETKARITALAKKTRRSNSFLTNEAVEKFLLEEEAFVSDVQAGADDIEAGRTLSSAEVKAALYDFIDEVSGQTKPV